MHRTGPAGMQKPVPTAPPEEVFTDDEAPLPVYQPSASRNEKKVVRVGIDNPRTKQIKFFDLTGNLPDEFSTSIKVKNGVRCRVYEGYNDGEESYKPLVEFNINGGPRGDFDLPVTVLINEDRTLRVSTKKTGYPVLMKAYYVKLSADEW